MTPFLLALTLLAATPDAWPAFQGVGASEIDPATIPLTWSPDQNIAWKATLTGKGQSSPIIWGETVYVTSIEGDMKDSCHVFALNLTDGSPRWKQSLPATQKVRSNYFQSRSAPTPVADSSGVVAFFETGELVAYDHSGKLRWKRSLTADYGEVESNIGLASSVLQTESSLIILVDHEGPSYVAAFDKSTGETLWKTERDSRKSYASPALIRVGNKEQVVCSSDGTVDGYDPQTGKLLWTFDEVGGNTSVTPRAVGDGKFLIGAAPGMHGEKETEARKSNLVMEILPTESGFKTKVLWRTEKAFPAFSSPMVYRDHAYWVNRQGVVFCYDAITGEQRYAQRTKQLCWATPVGIGDRIYFFGKDGVTTVLAAGAEFKVMAENQLWDPASAGADPLNRRRTESGDATASPMKTEEKVDSPMTEPSSRESSEPRRSRPASGSAEERALREKMIGMFADPVQYGVAIVNGSLVIRTGDTVYCVRSNSNPQK